MIEVLEEFPGHVAAFKATGNVTGSDYDKVLNPKVAKVYKENGKMNYLFKVETPLSNFTTGAWFKDAVLGFVYLTEWKRVAIVSDNGGVKNFTNLFGKVMPGTFRGFMSEDFEEAKAWVSEKIE